MCSENGIIKSIKFGKINDNVVIESNSQIPKEKLVSKIFWIFTLDFFSWYIFMHLLCPETKNTLSTQENTLIYHFGLSIL